MWCYKWIQGSVFKRVCDHGSNAGQFDRFKKPELMFLSCLHFQQHCDVFQLWLHQTGWRPNTRKRIIKPLNPHDPTWVSISICIDWILKSMFRYKTYPDITVIKQTSSFWFTQISEEIWNVQCKHVEWSGIIKIIQLDNVGNFISAFEKTQHWCK